MTSPPPHLPRWFHAGPCQSHLDAEISGEGDGETDLTEGDALVVVDASREAEDLRGKRNLRSFETRRGGLEENEREKGAARGDLLDPSKNELASVSGHRSGGEVGDLGENELPLVAQDGGKLAEAGAEDHGNCAGRRRGSNFSDECVVYLKEGIRG